MPRGELRNQLVVCTTHEEIGKVTEAIRAERKRAGQLGESTRVERLVPQNYTTTQKSAARKFREGQGMGLFFEFSLRAKR